MLTCWNWPEGSLASAYQLLNWCILIHRRTLTGLEVTARPWERSIVWNRLVKKQVTVKQLIKDSFSHLLFLLTSSGHIDRLKPNPVKLDARGRPVCVPVTFSWSVLSWFILFLTIGGNGSYGGGGNLWCCFLTVTYTSFPACIPRCSASCVWSSQSVLVCVKTVSNNE